MSVPLDPLIPPTVVYPTMTPQSTLYLPEESTPYGQQPDDFMPSYDSPLRGVRNVVNVAAGGPGALTNRINEANNNPNNHYIITLTAGVIYSKTSPSASATAPLGASAYPYITGKVTIIGSGAILERSNTVTALFRVLTVGEGGFLRIENLTVRRGRASATGGGGILNHKGTLEVYRSTIINNQVNFSSAEQMLGGGIYSFFGNLSVVESRILNNSALTTLSDGGGVGIIGGIDTYSTIVGSEISGNRANRYGNAIYVAEESVNFIDNCFYGNYNPNPTGNTTNISVELNLSSSGRLFRSWWGSPLGPISNGPATSSRDSKNRGSEQPVLTSKPVPCDRLPVVTPTLADYGIDLQGSWSAAEQSEILAAVTDIGNALAIFAADGLAAHVKFKQVMGIENPNGTLDQGFIQLIRVTNNAGVCETENNTNPKTITCGNLVDTDNNPRSITRYVIIHEFGHIFDNQSRRGGNATGLREYVATTRNNNQGIVDTDGDVIMGVVNCPQGNTQWLRGERGWQTGPASTYQSPADINFCNPQSPIFTDFQQNPSPYDTDLEANEESGADMFLNWVYRTATGTGFANTDWRPWTCGGCSDATLPGDARLNWTNAIMETIFNNRNWR